MINFIRQKQTPYGGAENYLSRLTKVLKEKKFDFEITNSNVPQFLPSWFKALYFNIEVCLQKRDFYFSLERITCADIYRAGDGVHKAFLESKIKQTATAGLNPLNPVYCYLEEKCFNHSRHIIANSQMIKRQIIEYYGIEESKVSVIYNGIDFPEYDQELERNSLLNEFNINDGTKIILYVGSGFKRKGVEDFLHIFSQLKTLDVVAFIVGKEKKLAYYQSLAKALEISDKVIFTGARKDVHQFYISSDVFLFPTHYEPFSNVVLEALYYQNVVFTSDQNGASEILDAEFVIDLKSLTGLAEKIDHLFMEPERLEKIKRQNNELARQFSIEKNVETTLTTLEQVFPNIFSKEH